MSPPERRPLRFSWLIAVAAAVVATAGCSSESNAPAALPGRQRAALPEPRTEVAGAAWQGMVAAAGGLTADGEASDRVDFYDATTDVWRPGPRLPTPLHHVGLAVLGDRLYVAGGYAQGPSGPSERGIQGLPSQASASGWQAQRRVLSLGPGEAVWRDEPPLATARGAPALAAAGARLVAIGGANEGGPLPSTEVLEPAAAGWRPGPDLTQAREHLGGAGAGGRVYAVGGRVGSLESNLRSVESWDPSGTDGWRAEPSLNDARGGDGASAVGSELCVAGGEAVDGTIASVECLRNGAWARVARLSEPRHGLAVAGVDGVLHVAGGGPTPGLSVSGAHEAFAFP